MFIVEDAIADVERHIEELKETDTEFARLELPLSESILSKLREIEAEIRDFVR